MSETVTTASTSTTQTPNTTAQTVAHDRGHSGKEVPARADKSQSEIADNLTEEKKEESPKPKVKKKYVVDKKEYELELDDETTDRFIQKGLAADKRLMEIASERKQLEQLASQIHEQRAQLQSFFELLQGGDEQAAEQMLLQAMGPERFAAVAKKHLLTQYEYDQLSPEARRAYDAERRAEQLQAQIQQREAMEQEARVKELQSTSAKEFEGMIIKALESNVIPRNERSIAHFVDYMKKYVERDLPIDETAMERIASQVKEDNIVTIRGMVQGFVEQAKAAKEAKDNNKLIRIGEELTGLFGEDIIDILRRSDLAKLRASQPELPKQILETPKVDTMPKKHQGYMSEDEWAEQRRKAAAEYDRANKAV